MNFNHLIRNKHGFTLIEILVVLGLVFVLAAIAIPNVLSYIGKGDRSAALEEQHNVLVAISAALHCSTDSPRTVSREFTDQKIPSDPGSTDTNDVAKHLDKTTRFTWSISDTGVLTPGSSTPLAP